MFVSYGILGRGSRQCISIVSIEDELHQRV